MASSTSWFLSGCITGLTFAYIVHLGLSLPWNASNAIKTSKRGSNQGQNFEGDDEDEGEADYSDTESEDEDELALIKAGKMGDLKAGFTDDLKLVLVINQELAMTKGKIAAQCGHATLACYKTLLEYNPKLLKQWERSGQAKIAVKAESTSHIEELQAQAIALGLCARTIQDAGRTQVAPGSRTVLGIGPGPVKLINQVTGKLKLL